MITPTAIIFDYGNVLSEPQGDAEVQAMAALLEMPKAEFLEKYWKHRLVYDQALLEPAEYWETVAERALSADEMIEISDLDGRSWSHPNQTMIRWAQMAREAGFKTAILSNIPTVVRDYVLGRKWLPKFDHGTYSCDLRITKPAPEIYEHCLRGLGVLSSETIFFDDRPANVRAAEKLGIHAVLFSTPRQAALDLRGRFVLPGRLIATLERDDEENQ